MPNIINFGKGTAADEQDLILQINNFFVGICGWELIDQITDTASDRDYVYKSSGTQPGRFYDLYMRWRGYGNYINTEIYSLYVPGGTTTGHQYNDDYTHSQCSSTSFEWYAFGDEDGCWVVWESGGYWFSAYTGYLQSYYTDDVWDNPACVIGQRYYDRFFDENRVIAPHPEQDRNTTNSGYADSFYTHKDIYNNMLAYHDPSNRDGTDRAHWPFVMYRPYDPGPRSVIGELIHCLWFPGNGVTSKDWYTISGTNYKYMLFRYSDDETTGYGPINTASGTDW